MNAVVSPILTPADKLDMLRRVLRIAPDIWYIPSCRDYCREHNVPVWEIEAVAFVHALNEERERRVKIAKMMEVGDE